MRRQGYRVVGYGSRKEALAGFANRFPDLVIIDVNLGTEVEGGFELCRELRAQSAQLPIIFLTARESELDAVSGLRLGADDYLTKRTSIEHLLARVAALFRRVEALRAGDAPGERLEQGSLTLDRDRMTGALEGDDRAAHGDRVLGRARPRPAPGPRPQPRAAHGRRQRRARRRHRDLADQADPGQVRRASIPKFDAIQTVYGMGYRWQVRLTDRGAAAAIDAALRPFPIV